jgi:hypothetical protein
MRVSKENPTYFNCKCQEHHLLYIDNEIRSKAFKSQDYDSVDSKDSRDQARSRKDLDVGILAEIVSKRFLEEYDHTVEISDDWRYDILVDDNIRIDVKCRDYTQTDQKYSDLLFRDRKGVDLTEDDFDYVLQVMINGLDSDKAYITGYCSSKTALEAERFFKARTHRTNKVKHNDLTKIGKGKVFNVE